MKEKKKSGGIGVLSAVQIVFIILKLTKLISWSWWVVLIPLWISVGVIAFLVVISIVAAILDNR